jgi:hypothetical protein
MAKICNGARELDSALMKISPQVRQAFALTAAAVNNFFPNTGSNRF